jgi:tetratricopeptide (TPR) repeat protein
MCGATRAVGLSRLLVFLCFSIYLLPGCAINPRMSLDELTEGESAILLRTPFYPQTEFQCGPAALAGVLNASGVPVEPEGLQAMVYLPQRQGSLQLELLAATRRMGRIAYLVESEPGDLLAQIHADLPVLVLQNLGTRSTPLWHYAVLTGFDVKQNELVLNSGEKRNARIPAGTFLRTWDWAGRWAMVALRPGQLPAAANAGRYAEAVALFERSASYSDSLLAWQAAEQRWPQDSRFQLALGNLNYAAGELGPAAERYRKGLLWAPDDPALTNNLAAVLAELGCPRTAEKLLAPVLLREGDNREWLPTLQQTAAELSAQTGFDPDYCASLFAGPN